MRGEDQYTDYPEEAKSGSPPHARGRLAAELADGGGHGITPACAGKTSTQKIKLFTPGDHPRMRGEDVKWVIDTIVGYGSPPHARGRPRPQGPGPQSHRITPACAGKTAVTVFSSHKPRDHPRMRGEDTRPCRPGCAQSGSPPHARGRRVCLYAGPDDRLDHPRMRGEDVGQGRAVQVGLGSPPHARGRQQARGYADGGPGITPACAGKTG